MKTHPILSGLAHVLAAVGLAVLAASLVYWIAIGPWQARWGATDAEVSQVFPGDDLVAQPQNQVTRAITIDAAAASVWPWLVQMGQGRGGLYSYETLENLIGCDMRNADSIVPEWQNTNVGDRVRMYPEGSGPPPYTVARIVPGQAFILGHSTEPGGVPAKVTPQTEWSDTWAFILQPVSQDSTRLIIRSRSTYADPTMSAIMNIIAPGYFLMERGMLYGIKERAERAADLSANYTSMDGWGAGLMLIALVGWVAYLFVGRWPYKLAIFPLGVVLWVAALFFGYPSAGLAALLVLLAVIALGWDQVSARMGGPASVQAPA